MFDLFTSMSPTPFVRGGELFFKIHTYHSMMPEMSLVFRAELSEGGSPVLVTTAPTSEELAAGRELNDRRVKARVEDKINEPIKKDRIRVNVVVTI